MVILLLADTLRAQRGRPSAGLQILGLTPGEARVAALVGSGRPVKDAARELGITESTARSALKVAYEKLRIRKQSELAKVVARLEGTGFLTWTMPRSTGYDTTTPSGRALLQMLGVFAEFEREMIKERVNAGLARAKAQGKRLGRPPVGSATEAKIGALRASGMGMGKVAQTVGVGVSVVQRINKTDVAPVVTS